MELKKFAERLRFLRKERLRLTLRLFAKAVGTSQGYVHELESGRKSRPSDELVSKICDAFIVRREWLVDGEGDVFSGVKEEPPGFGAQKPIPGNNYEVKYKVLIEGLPLELLTELVGAVLRDESKSLDFRLQMATEIKAVMDKRKAEQEAKILEARAAKDADSIHPR